MPTAERPVGYFPHEAGFGIRKIENSGMISRPLYRIPRKTRTSVDEAGHQNPDDRNAF